MVGRVARYPTTPPLRQSLLPRADGFRESPDDPTWTADGEVVIFHARVQLEGPPDLYAVRATGAGLHALTDDGRSRSPVGRPAG